MEFGNWQNMAMGILLLFIGLMCGIAAFRHTKVLKSLRREHQIHE
jgi:hypothetical protein